MSLPNQVKQKLIQIGDIDEERMDEIEKVINKFYINKQDIDSILAFLGGIVDAEYRKNNPLVGLKNNLLKSNEKH